MWKWLFNSARNSRIDLMHNHSLWMMPNVYSCNAVKGTDIPLVVSPHGTLSDWAMNSGSKVKKLFRPLLQRPALAATSCFHATSESECADIRRMGFDQPVAVMPNGIELPELPRTGRGNERTWLFLGRIHPIKGLDMLLSGWAALQNRFPEWKLRIVGPDNGGHRAEMEKLASRLGLKRI
jgi:glycosyltransferase involved in cell wall biosynthesis